MWLVLAAKPGATVILGVTKGTTPQAFKQAILDGKLEPHLHHIPVKAGTVVCVPAGSLHAIMDGLLIAEIQQNSNSTYRVYDWNRLQNGKPRQLHLDKAMAVINFDQIEPELCPPTLIDEENGVKRFELCANRYFVTERVEIEAGASFAGVCNGRSLEIWGVIEGAARIRDVVVTAVQFSLLPAAMGSFSVKSKKGAVLLRSFVPERE